jgi:hypothetical protein
LLRENHQSASIILPVGATFLYDEAKMALAVHHRVMTLLVLVAAGCYGAHREHPGDASNGTDGRTTADAAVTCGGTTCETPAATCANSSTLNTYVAGCAGGQCTSTPTEVACGNAGCCTDHCCELTVSNASDFGSITSTGLAVTSPDGTFDTDSQCTPTSELGHCEVVSRSNMPEACVCRMDTLTVGSLTITGSRALVILAAQTVEIHKLLDVSAHGGVAGPGASYTDVRTPEFNAGGVGGTFASPGGSGGSYTVIDSGTSNSDTPTAVYGNAALIPLLGGTQGETTSQSGAVVGTGGGGGGALQISAGNSITVSGKILAGGGGGHGGYVQKSSTQFLSAGGGGGGSGGAILLEAPVVNVTGTVSAVGGGGGSGYLEWAFYESNNGVDGSSGGAGGAAEIVDCPGMGGGGGGAGAKTSSAGITGAGGQYYGFCGVDDTALYYAGGGGGGGAGRIRINTASSCGCSGTFSPTPTYATTALH